MSTRYRPYLKRPRVGTRLATARYGTVTVVRVHDNGVALTVRTERHGEQKIERSPMGWWLRTRSGGEVK